MRKQTILSDILTSKKSEVKQLRASHAHNSFSELFKGQRDAPRLIAEIKPRSPSAGQLSTQDPLELAKEYEAAGVDAISVLTDRSYFGGSLDLLKQIRAKTNIPLLRKDFIIDELQLIESVRSGADAVLLIVRLLTPQKLKSMISFAEQLGLAPLVEIASSQEAAIALKAGANIIGVNARNLEDFTIDMPGALGVLEKLPSHTTKLLLSGVTSRDDVVMAGSRGAHGVLVGTALVTAPLVTQKVKELRGDSAEYTLRSWPRP